VHLLEWPEVPSAGVDEDRWTALRAWRTKVNEAIEPLRREKVLGSGLEANVELLASDSLPARFEGLSLEELFITADVTIRARRGEEAEALATRTTHHKCGRCWRHLPDVAEDGALCSRCDHVVAGMDVA
jgi:isoleucyl-tRNA synthetase